jgi:antitoxin component of RelBE/YafQ-DinJ toxin-antitoxin module
MQTQIMIRLSERLKERIEAKAREMELSTSAAIRTILIQATSDVKPPARRGRPPKAKEQADEATVKERLRSIVEAAPDLDNEEIWQAYKHRYGDDCTEADYMRALRGLAGLRR